MRLLSKITFAGDMRVGKTALLIRIIDNEFRIKTLPTLGVDFFNTNWQSDLYQITMQLWEIGGMPYTRHSFLAEYYFLASTVNVLVFDLTDYNTLKSIPEWKLFVKKATNPDIILVGNKKDLKRDSRITSTLIEYYKRLINTRYYIETSAKTGEGLEELFDCIIQNIVIYNEKIIETSLTQKENKHIFELIDSAFELMKKNDFSTASKIISDLDKKVEYKHITNQLKVTIDYLEGKHKKMKKTRIFIAFSEKDKRKAQNLYKKLKDEGFSPWIYTKDGLGGEKWRQEIPERIRESDFFIACLSTNSVTKDGFFQKELKIALDIWEEKTPQSNFLIPIKLDNCIVPNILVSTTKLSDLTWIEYFKKDGYQRIIRSINSQIQID